MKNIEELLKEVGIEIPEDKADDFKKSFNENYKTVAEYSKVKANVDNWKSKAETAEETLKGFEGIDPAKLNDEIANWKKKAEDAEKTYNENLYKRDFADALEREMNKVKFTSASAKEAVMKKISESGIQYKEGKLYGLQDVLADIRTNDASAFVDEHQETLEKQKVTFTKPMVDPNGNPVTRESIASIKDPVERRKAIKNNPGLFN